MPPDGVYIIHVDSFRRDLARDILRMLNAEGLKEITKAWTGFIWISWLLLSWASLNTLGNIIYLIREAVSVLICIQSV